MIKLRAKHIIIFNIQLSNVSMQDLTILLIERIIIVQRLNFFFVLFN
jgi:hypothetical protein